VSRTPQQDIGDELEQDALTMANKVYPDASLTKGSGSLNQDGDIAGVPDMHVECKNSAKPGKGRSIAKADWIKIKNQARRRGLTPCHLGYDDDGEIVALIPWEDLLGFAKMCDLSDMVGVDSYQSRGTIFVVCPNCGAHVVEGEMGAHETHCNG